MSVALKEDGARATLHSYRVAVLALNNLPDRCAPNVGELAARIGADKLDLLNWIRADVNFARLIASKVAT